MFCNSLQIPWNDKINNDVIWAVNVFITHFKGYAFKNQCARHWQDRKLEKNARDAHDLSFKGLVCRLYRHLAPRLTLPNLLFLPINPKFYTLDL